VVEFSATFPKHVTEGLLVIRNVWNQTALNPVACLKSTNRCRTN
jgi:hypothetical protein